MSLSQEELKARLGALRNVLAEAEAMLGQVWLELKDIEEGGSEPRLEPEKEDLH